MLGFPAPEIGTLGTRHLKSTAHVRRSCAGWQTGASRRSLFWSHGATACRLLTIHTGLVLGFDQSGNDLLYVLGSRPPALWRATIGGGHLVARRRLIQNSPVEAVGW
jgi:hypothetical protein